LLAGPGAERALRRGGAGRMEVALGAGGYVRLGADRWLLLAGPRAAVGPLSLLVAGLEGIEARAGWPARVERATLVVGPLRIDLSGCRTAGAPALTAVAPGSWPAVAAAAAVCPRPPDALLVGLGALERGELARAVQLLAGRGDGLTPAGDDVLAGYAGWAAATRDPAVLSVLAAGRSSPIGLAYLRCAERGELPAAAAAVIAAAVAGDRETAIRRVRVLRRWGSSSGSALMWGIAAGARGTAAPAPALGLRSGGSVGRGRP
jgi:Protein of unknown function (DUF2877)